MVPGPLYLGRGSLVGVFPGLERPNAHAGQLGLEDGHAAAGGRQQFEGRLQRRAQGRLGLHGLLKYVGQTLEQVLHQLGTHMGGYGALDTFQYGGKVC